MKKKRWLKNGRKEKKKKKNKTRIILRTRKQRKDEFYFILAGGEYFGEILNGRGIDTDKLHLLKVGVYSRLGNAIKKEAVKQIKNEN